MAYEIPGLLNTLLAAADLRSSQYRAVVVNSSGRAALAGAAARDVGILQNSPNTGEAGTVMWDGVSKVVAAAAITAGALVATNASGQVITATTGQASCGVARTAAGGANEIISVQLMSSVAP